MTCFVPRSIKIECWEFRQHTIITITCRTSPITLRRAPHTMRIFTNWTGGMLTYSTPKCPHLVRVIERRLACRFETILRWHFGPNPSDEACRGVLLGEQPPSTLRRFFPLPHQARPKEWLATRVGDPASRSLHDLRKGLARDLHARMTPHKATMLWPVSKHPSRRVRTCLEIRRPATDRRILPVRS